jgi:UPF0755 protein
MVSFNRRLRVFLSTPKMYLRRFWRYEVLACVGIFLGGYFLFVSPPANFPSGSIIVISKGASAPEIVQELANTHIVTSPFVLKLVLRISGESSHIQTGAYRFKTPANVFTVAYRISTGDYGLPLTRITFVEGTTVVEAATQVAEAFPGISAADFLAAGKPYEGYLFPDTYFFSSVVDAESIVQEMRANFTEKTVALLGDLYTSGHSLSDIITMASIIEKETRTDTDRHIVAGILWRRLEIGMPLQVDVARETYKQKGLPTEPICSPGLDSIDAALHPTKTTFMYYLTGRDGLMHYATTFAGHQANLRKYLK